MTRETLDVRSDKKKPRKGREEREDVLNLTPATLDVLNSVQSIYGAVANFAIALSGVIFALSNFLMTYLCNNDNETE